LARSFVSPWSFALEPAPFEYRGAVRRAFLDNPVAQRAVRIVAEGVGCAPLASSEATVLKLVGTASAGQGLLETLSAHLLLHGNAYVQIVRGSSGPVELFALRPERVAADRLDVTGADFAAGEAPSVPLVEVREAA
jgi:phage portal protein BeeE